MTRLSLNQRAKRAAKMRNKRTHLELPLLDPVLEGAGFLTTEDEQRERLEKQEQENDRYFARIDASGEIFLERASERRSIIADRVDAETLSLLDLGAAKSWLTGHPARMADYWWQRLKQYAPDVAQEKCHLKEMHNMYGRWHEFCPGCGLRLEKPPEKDEPQLTLF